MENSPAGKVTLKEETFQRSQAIDIFISSRLYEAEVDKHIFIEIWTSPICHPAQKAGIMHTAGFDVLL